MESKSGFVAYVQVISLIASILTVGVGLAHLSIVLALSNWCESSAGISCLGPSLRWITGSNPIQDVNGNSAWRSVFTVAPDLFLENGTPLIFGLIGVFLHFPTLRMTSVNKSWLRMAGFFIFNGVFCNLGYAGDFGVLVGFFSVFVAFNCLIIRFAGEKESPTTMDFLAESNEGGSTGTCWKSLFVLPLDDVILAVSRLFTTLVACLTVIVGVIHLFNSIGIWCNNAQRPQGVSCIGPWLGFRTSFPNGAVDFFSFTSGNVSSTDTNRQWRTVFSITPGTFFELFCPMVCGGIILLAHSPKLRVHRFVGSWSRLWLFQLFVAMFANFGYAGNLGIVTGFLSVFVSALCLVIVISDRSDSSPFLDVAISFNITDAADGSGGGTSAPLKSMQRADSDAGSDELAEQITGQTGHSAATANASHVSLQVNENENTHNHPKSKHLKAHPPSSPPPAKTGAARPQSLGGRLSNWWTSTNRNQKQPVGTGTAGESQPEVTLEAGVPVKQGEKPEKKKLKKKVTHPKKKKKKVLSTSIVNANNPHLEHPDDLWWSSDDDDNPV